MVNLRSLLDEQTWRMLRAIAYAHHLTFNPRVPREEAAMFLAAHLEDDATLARIVRHLSDAELTALRSLCVAEQPYPRYRFIETFGAIRPLKAWRKHDSDAPWIKPASTAERLVYLGLVYAQSSPTGAVMVLPDEVHARLARRPTPEHVPVPAQPPVSPVLDLAHLLAYLQGHEVKALSGHWMAPSHLRALNRTLAHPEPQVASARSEFQTGYLRFLHYLSEVAGLVAPVLGRLALTPQAWSWLEAGQVAQHRALLAGWMRDVACSPSTPCLWSRYRLPGAPVLAWGLLTLLTSCPPGPYALHPIEQDLRARIATLGPIPEPDNLATDLGEILIGPLTWLGWSVLHEKHVSLTPLGHHVLNQDGPTLARPATGPTALAVLDESTLVGILPTPPVHPALRALVTLGLPIPDTAGGNDATLTRVLTRERFATLLSAGYAPAWVAEQLRELSQAPLPTAILDQLQTWIHHVHEVRLRYLCVLSVGTPDIRDDILANLRPRRLPTETLSPHHIAVAPNDAPQLLARLRRQGYTPLAGAGLLPGSPPSATPPRSEFPDEIPLDRGAAAHLWLALRVFLDLADMVRLPGVPPAGLLDQLGVHLGLETVAMENLAQQISDRVRDVLDGYTPFPAPLPDLDVEAVLSILEDAVAADQPLTIVYHTAGRGERTTRVVEPLRIEERGGAVYLIAYCRLRQEERVFRVDRIERASLANEKGMRGPHLSV